MLKVDCTDIRLARSLSGSTGVSHVAKESTEELSITTSEDKLTVDLLDTTDSIDTTVGGSGNDDAIDTIDNVTIDGTARDDGWLDMYLSNTFLIAISTRPWP